MSGALDNRIELLSPAGDLKCFYAAINAGAIDPYDYTDALNEAGRKYYEDALKVFMSVYGE